MYPVHSAEYAQLASLGWMSTCGRYVVLVVVVVGVDASVDMTLGSDTAVVGSYRSHSRSPVRRVRRLTEGAVPVRAQARRNLARPGLTA